MGNLDVDKAMQTLVEHGFIDKDGHPINIPSVRPTYTDAEIQKMQELQFAEVEKAFELGKAEVETCEDTISRQAMIYGLASIAKAKAKSDAQKSLMGRVMFFTEQLPSVTPEQEPCEDAISIQVVIEWLKAKDIIKLSSQEETVRKELKALPPATPKQKMGRWIYGEDNLGTGRDGWYCNHCGHFEFWDYNSDMQSAKLNLPNPCPNCGCAMFEPQTEKENKE